jgi:hypothetical protein
MTPAKAIQKIKQSKTVKRQQTILHSSAVGGDSKTNVDAVQVIEGQSQTAIVTQGHQTVRLIIMCS